MLDFPTAELRLTSPAPNPRLRLVNTPAVTIACKEDSMLRDLPPFHANEHLFVDMSGMEHEETHQNDLLDDVFGSAPASPNGEGQSGQEEIRNGQDHSDIRRLRSTHVTSGYREGIAESKGKYIQEGFDEGYSLGAELGLKAGWCLGVLEGICKALPAAQDNEAESPAEILAKAREELKMEKLYGTEFFGSDGIWIYDVTGKESETTFRKVANAHPVLKSWHETTTRLAQQYGLALK